MNYREHRYKVLSKRCFFRSLDKDEIICPESDDAFFERKHCDKCDKKFNCEAWNMEKYDEL